MIILFGDLVADIRLLENVQKRFTRTGTLKVYCDPLQPLYTISSKIFDPESLEYRRLKFDLTRRYRIVLCFSDIPLPQIFQFALPLSGNQF